MREKVKCVVDAIRSAEAKIKQCNKEREELLHRLRAIEHALETQLQSKSGYERELDDLLALDRPLGGGYPPGTYNPATGKFES